MPFVPFSPSMPGREEGEVRKQTVARSPAGIVDGRVRQRLPVRAAHCSGTGPIHTRRLSLGPRISHLENGHRPKTFILRPPVVRTEIGGTARREAPRSARVNPLRSPLDSGSHRTHSTGPSSTELRSSSRLRAQRDLCAAYPAQRKPDGFQGL